jgi:ribonuclease Z
VRRGFKVMMTVLAVAGLLVGAGAIAFVVSPNVQDKGFAYAARTQLGRQGQMPDDADALHVLLCGTSSPMPTRVAAKACTMVSAGGMLFLVDVGPESSENLALWRIPSPKIQGVFLTHFHSDHIGELGEINMQGWAQGRRTALPVYGGPGIEQVVGGFNMAYAADRRYRHAHHDRGRGLLPLEGAEMRAQTIAMPAQPDSRGVRSTIAYRGNGLTVTAIETNHRPVQPAYSYRFDYKGRSVLITGDTVYHKPLASAAKGVDLLVSEAQSYTMQDIIAAEAEAVGQSTLGRVLRDTRDYHINPVDAARMANEAGARMLLYTHVAPALVNPLLKAPWLRGVEAVRPKGVQIGEDGLVATIPSDGGKIRWTRLKG